MKKRQKSYRDGLRAEYIAAWFLRLKGYHILEQRYKTPFGEIDLIARRGKTIMCVEVKYRRDTTLALMAVSEKSQQRIINTAEYFRAHFPRYTNYNIRFDVISIAPPFSLHHHKNAWGQ